MFIHDYGFHVLHYDTLNHQAQPLQFPLHIPSILPDSRNFHIIKFTFHGHEVGYIECIYDIPEDFSPTTPLKDSWVLIINTPFYKKKNFLQYLINQDLLLHEHTFFEYLREHCPRWYFAIKT